MFGKILSQVMMFDYLAFLCEERCRFCGREVECRIRKQSIQPPGEDSSDELLRTLCADCSQPLQNSKAACWQVVLSKEAPCETASKTESQRTMLVYTGARYIGPVQKLIRRCKYDGDRLAAADLAYVMFKALGLLYKASPSLLEQNPVFVPVPLHRERKRNRGFNQAELLVRLLSDRTGIAYNTSALGRVRRTSPQFGLTRQERMLNMDNAFSCQSIELRNKTVLLADDVYTTGATLAACGRVLLASGAKSVYALAAARAEDLGAH